MRQDPPMTVPPRRGLLRRIPRLCKILALGLAVSTLAQAAPRGTGGSLYPQKTAIDALASGDVGQRGGTICPEPPGVFQICAPVAPIDCVTGTPGEECWPTNVVILPAGPEANLCDCFGPEATCGPVTVTIDPVAGFRYTCGFPCPNAGEKCLVFIHGVSSGATSVTSGQLNNDDQITCRCDPYENWVIADDFCLEGCDRCECDVNGDDTCDLNDLAFMQNCFGSTDPACRAADLNCDGIVTIDDVTILQCFLASGTAAECCPGAGAGAVIDRVRWYGSYFDPDFEPPTDDAIPPLRRPDSWLIAIHTDIPATPCPPPPVGSMSVDWCGELELCLGTTNLVFRPEGSAFTYSLDDPNNLLAGLGAGDQLRICGHQPVIITPPCVDTIGFVVVDAVSTCQSKVSRPDRLIAQWVIPDPLVTVAPTGKAGWDGHRIFDYTADLTCLVHNFADPGEIDSMGNFHPVPGKTYWISIQAAVGHTVDAACNEVTTGETVNQDYWGWHTTPPGHQHKDDAYMGQLAMGCEGEWLYNWMNHLHSSQPPFKDCADDPTKSIDMAFYLIDAESTCSASGVPCQIDANCAVGETCVTSEVVHWCQPVNPGPPIIGTPVPTPFPNDAIDELTLTIADVQVNLDFIPFPLDLHFEGPTVVWRGIEHEDIGRGHCKNCWSTEMVSMDLAGIDPTLGECTLRVTPLGSSGQDGVRSLGSTTENTGCQCMDAEWDLNVEVECEIGPDGRPFVVVVETPIHLTAQIFEVPPMNVTFVSDPQPVVLIDRATLQPVGTIKSATHFIPYKGGVNIHSDVDWTNTPTEECCEPLLDGSGCEQVVCPDPLEECVPVEYECSSTCFGTVNPCTTDADCGGVTCVTRCVVTDCDCQRPDKCHAFADTTLPDPVFCVNSCPNGQVCERIEIDTDVPPDGIPDRFRCRCDEADPLFCPLPPPSGVVDPCQQLQLTDCITDVFNGEECLPRFMTLTFVGGSEAVFVSHCDCFVLDGECGPIATDPLSGDIICTGDCVPPNPPGDCVIFANGVSLHVSSISPALAPAGNLWCDCEPTPPNGACCIDADTDGIVETCIITTDTDCAAQGGTFHGDGTICGTIGACCLDTDGDGRSETCIEMDSTCCDDANGTFLGTGAICEGDLNGNGIDDACDCDVLTGERIILRSGNGAIGGFDTAITVLPGVSNFPLSAFSFTPLDFLQACVLGPASVIAPNGAWLPGSAGVLPSDPLAQWIGPFPNSAGGSFAQPASGLFCQEFDVCCPDITAATITIAFAADDQVGDIPFGPNNIGVYINGPPGLLGFSGIGFGSEIIITGPAVGLVSGANTLHVYLRDVHAVASGLIYSVTIDVDCALEACCFPDEHCEDLDPCCCRDLGGTPQGTGTDCASVDCPQHDPPFCPLPATGGLLDPCFGLQLTDCPSDNPDQLCLPICVENELQVNGTVVAVATKCDCIDDSGDCGPVEIGTIGPVPAFVCNPKICLDPLEECWIHINGSPIGASSIATSAVAVGAEVKCKCAHTEGDPCPTPLPPMLDPCGVLQVTNCKDGLAGETCLPICMEIIQDAGGFTPVATLCDCIDSDGCGPVKIQTTGTVTEFVCDPTICPDPLDECWIHLNGSPIGTSSIATSAVAVGTEVKCKCAHTEGDPCPTPLPPMLDPCGVLQVTNCKDGLAGETCLPVCVENQIQIDGTVLAVATLCDCVSGDECGPVKIVDNGIFTEFVCDPTICPDPLDECWIHLNGSPIAASSIATLAVAVGTEVKCKCAHEEGVPCPTPLSPPFDPCGALQATDCLDGVVNELCRPICVEVEQVAGGLDVVATLCDCVDKESCGPVRIDQLPAPGGVRLTCDPTLCLDPLETCQVHLNGSPTGQTSIDVNNLAPGTEVKCKCADTAFDPCPTELPPALDPCGALQATDCADGVAGELCVPICVEINLDLGLPIITATVCDCVEGDECGPVKVSGFDLFCDPTTCPNPGETCQIHINGSPTGANTINAGNVPGNSEVKCKCATTCCDPCPTPLPPTVDPCGALQATDCDDGVAGETCLPVCVEISQDATGLTPAATQCDCFGDDSCGPVKIDQLPDPPGGFRLTCDPTLCLDPLETCQVHLNGSPTGQTSVDVDTLSPSTEVKCKCTTAMQFDPCPTPLPPSDDPCGLLQSMDCEDGLPGELCVPICLVIEQDAGGLVPVATLCDCREGGCGPILIEDFPGGTTGLRCNPDPCPTAGTFCEPHVNGVAQGASSVIVSDLNPGDEVKCRCPLNQPLPEDSLEQSCTDDLQCEGTSFCLKGRCYVHKNRYISIRPNNAGQAVKLKVTLSASLPHPGLVGNMWWVKAPDPVVPNLRPKPLLGPGECVATLGSAATAAEIDWDLAGCQTLHITGCAIEPTSKYEVQAVAGIATSAAVIIPTAPLPNNGRFWCDVAGTNPGTGWRPPQGATNFNDVFAIIQTFQGGQIVAPTASVLHLTWADVEGGNNNTVVNIGDVFVCILAWQQTINLGAYPFGPADANGNCP